MGPVNLPSVIVDTNTRINMHTENWRMMSPAQTSNSERVVRDYSPQFKGRSCCRILQRLMVCGSLN